MITEGHRDPDMLRKSTLKKTALLMHISRSPVQVAFPAVKSEGHEPGTRIVVNRMMMPFVQGCCIKLTNDDPVGLISRHAVVCQHRASLIENIAELPVKPTVMNDSARRSQPVLTRNVMLGTTAESSRGSQRPGFRKLESTE